MPNHVARALEHEIVAEFTAVAKKIDHARVRYPSTIFSNFNAMPRCSAGKFERLLQLHLPLRAHLTWLALALFCLCGLGHAADERRNYFNDPFLQVTDGLDQCPRQVGPRITLSEMRAQAHDRAERGTSCYQSGRCRLPNAYLYDHEIIARVKKAIVVDGRFSDTSIWVEGQRRWVWLKGCVHTSEQSIAIENVVRGMDDVEMVINELVEYGR